MRKQYKKRLRALAVVLVILIVDAIILLVGNQIGAQVQSKKEPTNWESYMVEPGETISEIAIEITPNSKDYRHTVYYIKEKNGIKDSKIYSGRTILVPVMKED